MILVEVLLSTVDLAAAGLAWDICGAAIVARALFQSKGEIIALATTDLRLAARGSAGTEASGGVVVGHPAALLSLVEDRVDGTIGLAYLCLGFSAQAAAVIATAGVESQREGVATVFTALVIVFVSATVALAAYRVLRRRLIKRLLDSVLREPAVDPSLAASARRMHRDPSLRARSRVVRK